MELEFEDKILGCPWFDTIAGTQNRAIRWQYYVH